jgi:hypothetical protein
MNGKDKTYYEMTPEEALDKLDKTVIGDLELKIALTKALEKQIPKKPIKIPDNHKCFCPTCHNPIRLGRNHCCNCGQKL